MISTCLPGKRVITCLLLNTLCGRTICKYLFPLRAVPRKFDIWHVRNSRFTILKGRKNLSYEQLPFSKVIDSGFKKFFLESLLFLELNNMDHQGCNSSKYVSCLARRSSFCDTQKYMSQKCPELMQIKKNIIPLK